MTGAEALQKIMDSMDALTATVNELKASIQMIEANIKVLNNRAAGLMREAPSPTSVVGAGVNAPVMRAAAPARGRQLIETPEAPQQEQASLLKEDGPGVMTYKKVFGRLVNSSGQPIENVLINIYDQKNDVCATAETDPIGYWETMVRPGRYIAEYVKTGFKPTNKTFDVGKNAKEVEVK